jgi:hypothetical protein
MAHVSLRFTTQEQRASSIFEVESLAMLFGTDKLLPYFENAEFFLNTDNQALSWLLSHPREFGKFGRWVVKYPH